MYSLIDIDNEENNKTKGVKKIIKNRRQIIYWYFV